MDQKNHPNACNMCHTKEPIDWTLTHLKDWYGKTYSENKLSKSYPNRDGPVATNWLTSKDPAVRLVAADSLLTMRRSLGGRDMEIGCVPFICHNTAAIGTHEHQAQ